MVYLGMSQWFHFDLEADWGFFLGCAQVESPESTRAGLDSGDLCTGVSGFTVAAAARAGAPTGARGYFMSYRRFGVLRLPWPLSRVLS